MSEENHIVPLTDIYQYQSNTGLVIPDTSNVQSQVIEGLKNVFGADFEYIPETPNGLLVDALTQLIKQFIGITAQNVNGLNITTSIGSWLDAIGRLFGVEREDTDTDYTYRKKILQSCSRGSGFVPSIYNAIMKSARSGIVPDGVNGYLIPYGNECTLQFSYRGLCDMAIRERIATRFKADVVYSNDEFEWENAELKKHIPAGWDEEERGRIVGVWVGACIDDGTWVYERMSYKEIELVRSKSQNKNGVWATWWGEMAKKACLKRLFKKMRNTPSMQEAVNIDNESFKINENIIDAAPHAGVKKNIAALSAPKVEEQSQTIDLTHEKVREPVVEEEPLPFE